MADLAAKITREGEAEAKAYKEYFEWCDDASQNINYEIGTATKQKGKLEAKISQLGGSIEASASKIDDLAAATAATASQLKNATAIREKEAADFAAGENELMDVVSTLERATSTLEREMAKNPASFAQVDTSNAKSILQSLSVVVEAAGLSTSDRQRLVALVQGQQTDEAEDMSLGAPAAANYKTHSSNIFDVLEDLKAKAEGELADLRKAEATAKHSYDMLTSSLEAQAAADSKDMSEEKAGLAQASEEKATAEGDLQTTTKRLADSADALATAHTGCMQTAADHEATVGARKEELKVIAEATEILKSTSSGAVGQTYSLVQLAQGARMRTRADLAGSEVVALVKRVAREQHSAALAQLATHVDAVLRFGATSGEDVFGKVKGLVRDLIERLEAEAQSEATEKAYCDEQMAKTEAKKGELDDDIAKLTVKIDQATARKAQLKDEVKDLQLELSALMKLQAEMGGIRQETHADYTQARADLELGLNGVRKALGVLRSYYAAQAEGAASMLQASGAGQQPAMPEKHAKAAGAGQSIVGILEVVEGDFATNLAKEETQEEDAQTEYDKVTQENKVSSEMKTQDVKYKTSEIGQLSKSLTELSSDRDSSNAELTAVLEYYAKIKERCIAKPETYEQRKARREAEIKGLKEALHVLQNEVALVQRQRRGHLRHAVLAAQ